MTLLSLMMIGSSWAGDLHPMHGALGAGSTEPGQWSGSASLGWPWSKLRAQVALEEGWTAVADYSQALNTRYQPAAGLGKVWREDQWRLGGEALVGWQVQTGLQPHRSAALETRIRSVRLGQRAAPFLSLGTRWAPVLGTEVTYLLDGSVDRGLSLDSEWSLTGELGSAFPITDRLAVEVTLDFPWVDLSSPSLPLPGGRLGLILGGPP